MKLLSTPQAVVLVGVCALGSAAASADPDRQAEVAARGAQVMPFNLSETTHIFTKTPSGGLQQVIAKDPQNAEQIRMIRLHLGEIAANFARGNFSAPANLHGPQMPGLATLKSAKPGDISIRYSDLANGGQIEYSTQNPTIVSSIHDWFDAQLSDHGSDAMEGHSHGAPVSEPPVRHAFELMQQVPGAVWGAVIAALIAFGATVLTNRNSRKQLQMQLDNDRRKRERERTLSLRRSVYLPAAEALIRAQQTLADVIDIDVPGEEPQRVLSDALAVCSRIHVVGSERTVRALMEYVAALAPAYMELLTLRIPLVKRNQQAIAHQAVADKANADLARTTELMKQFNLSGQTDSAAWDRLVRQSKRESELMHEETRKSKELRDANMAATLDLALRMRDLGAGVASLFPDVLLAARAELDLPIDAAEYRQLMDDQLARAVSVSNEVYEELRRSVAASDHSLQGDTSRSPNTAR